MKKKSYKAFVICRNCEYGKPYSIMDGGKELLIPVGKKVKDMPCPNCGCKELYNSKNTCKYFAWLAEHQGEFDSYPIWRIDVSGRHIQGL